MEATSRKGAARHRLNSMMSAARFKLTMAVAVMIAALSIAACLAAPAAFADSYTVYNYNSDPTSNIQTQTIVGEGSNNNVVVTNAAETPPSPTGIASTYAPVIGVIALIVCAGTVIVLNARRRACRLGGE